MRGAEMQQAVPLSNLRLGNTPARLPVSFSPESRSFRFDHLPEQFRPGGEFGVDKIPHLQLFSLFSQPKGSETVGQHEYQHALAAWAHFVPVYGMYIGKDTGWAAIGKADDAAMQEILSFGSWNTGGGASDYLKSGWIDRKHRRPFGSSFLSSQNNAKERVLSKRSKEQLQIGGRLAASRGYLSSSEILQLDERASFEAKWEEEGLDLKETFLSYSNLNHVEISEEQTRSQSLYREPDGVDLPSEYTVIVEERTGRRVILVKDGRETMRCPKCGGAVLPGHRCSEFSRQATIYPISLQ